MTPHVGPGHRILDRYEIVRHVATGATGTVFQARDLILDQVVALKNVGFAGRGDAEQARRRTLREARSAARLRHHHRVVSIYDVLEVEGEVWLVLEYLPSQSLAAVTRDGGVLAPGEAARIGAAVADALAAAHRSGIVHRDVRPANVLLGRGANDVKLTDFGVSHADGEHPLTAPDVLTGTPAYLSGEVARGGPETAASDVFSLGATLYRAVEGRPPFGDDDDHVRLLQRVANGTVDPPRRAGPLTGPLLRLLDPDPGARPDAETAQRLLEDVARGHPATSRTGRARRGRTALLRRPVPIAIAAAAALGLAAGLVFLLRDPTAVPELPGSVPALTVGDQRTADPCALLDTTVMGRFGPSAIGPSNSVFQCRLTTVVPDGRLLFTEAYVSTAEIDDDGADAQPPQDLGGLRIVRKGLTPAFGCLSYLRFRDGTQVGVYTVPEDPAQTVPGQCDVHEAALAVAVDELVTSGFTYRPGWQGDLDLADETACELVDTGLQQVPGLDDRRRGYPNGAACFIGGDAPGGPLAAVSLGLEPTGDISGNGTAREVNGVVAYTRPGTRTSGTTSACFVAYPHRVGPPGRPTEFIRVQLAGTAPYDELCRQGVALGAATARAASR